MEEKKIVNNDPLDRHQHVAMTLPKRRFTSAAAAYDPVKLIVVI